LQIKTKIVSCHTAESKPVRQEVNGTVILPPLVFPDLKLKLGQREKSLKLKSIGTHGSTIVNYARKKVSQTSMHCFKSDSAYFSTAISCARKSSQKGIHGSTVVNYARKMFISGVGCLPDAPDLQRGVQLGRDRLSGVGVIKLFTTVIYEFS
jgi:hypothetical protein